MAKRQKVKRFSVQTFDAAHYRQTEQYTQAVDALFDKATAEIARAAAKGKYDPDKPFSFDDYPSVKAVMQSVTKQLASRITTVIETGSKKQWLFACSKNDGFISSILDTSKLSKAQLKMMQDQNLDALKTFQGRKVEGMNLSQRVWKYVGQYREQLEAALDAGLGEGRSAAQLSRDVRQNLREPNRLFRRVRDKRGNLVLSKAAKAFHPGRGVYRSSAKNAARLTRSEINMAYRESDYLRWQSLDFVVGFEVKRSNHEPLCKCDICEKLKGRYPKHFKFKGWHPQCMCYAVPILMDEETFDENELGDLKAALRGTQYKRLEAKNVVVDVPDGFKEWVKEHEEAQANWSSTPYFIKDNFTDGKLSKGLNFETKKQIDPVQQQLNALMPQITQARMLASKWGLTVQLQMLDKYVAEKDIVRIPNRIATIQQKAAEIQQKDADIRAKCSEWGLNTYILDDAMATLWHEITHNRNVPGNMYTTSIQTDVMEMMNEFVARKTLPEFYSKLGCAKTPQPQFINNRDSTGYNRRVLGYDFVIQKLGLDPDKVLQSAKKSLFALKYSEQETTAIQALLDGGLDTFKGANGKKIGKAQLKKIVAMCRRGASTTTIENYLKNEGIIK